MIVAKLVGKIHSTEHIEGTFECFVHVDPQPRTSPPLGYVIGYAIRQPDQPDKLAALRAIKQGDPPEVDVDTRQHFEADGRADDFILPEVAQQTFQPDE